MRRRVMSYAQLERALPAGQGKPVRFVVVEAIPGDDGAGLSPGDDVTDLVRSGAMPEDVLRSHVKRSVIVPVQTGRVAGLARQDTSKMTRDDLRGALEAAGIVVAAGNTSDHMRAIRDVVVEFARRSA